MAKLNSCDLCKQDGVHREAVDTVELKSKNTTPVSADVCEEHFTLYKKLVHLMTGQNKEIKNQVEEVVLPEVG